MRGVLAHHRASRLTLRLLGATALACIIAGGVLPGAALAQSVDLGSAEVSRDAEMLLEADTVVYDNDRDTVTAIGGVRIDYDGYRLVAQRVAYDRRTSRLVASGNVEIVDRDGTRITSDEIDITDDLRDGFVQALRVETADKTYFAAESADRREGSVTTFTRGVYTACEPCEERPDKAPAWRIKAQKIIWNGETKTVRFERARFELFGLPLAFLPAFEIADPTVKQKTGFLIPSYKGGTDIGHGAQVPFYWAIDPSYDLTFKPAWYSEQGFLGEVEWRQRFNNGEYSITIAGMRQRNPENFLFSTSLTEQNASDFERNRGMIGSKGRFEINPRWTFGWDVLAQTDKNFARRYEIDGYDQARRTNEVYLTGLNDRNYFDLRFYKFNVQEPVRNFDRDTGLPIGSARDARQPWVLPSFDYSYTPDTAVAGGELNFDINVQGISRRLAEYAPSLAAPERIAGLDGTSGRVTAEVEWKRSFVTPGGLMLTPLLHARADAIGANYDSESLLAIDNMASYLGVAADVRSAYYRTMATAGLEARWPVLFSTSSSTHVLEPMGQLFARPNEPHGETLGIPNEDSQAMVFDASNLFERDKFAGYDRIEGGVRANLGVRYSGTFDNGWSAHGLFGQSFHLAGNNPYASPDLVRVGAASGLETDRSDYVASFGVLSPVGLSLGAGARFDEETFAVRRTDVTAGYRGSVATVAGAYSFIEAQPEYGFGEDRHEVRANASLRVAENWRVFGSGTYDITKDALVRRGIGFAYDDDCFSYAISASEYVNPDNSSDRRRSFGFQVSLRTLGDFGSSSAAFQ